MTVACHAPEAALVPWHLDPFKLIRDSRAFCVCLFCSHRRNEWQLWVFLLVCVLTGFRVPETVIGIGTIWATTRNRSAPSNAGFSPKRQDAGGGKIWMVLKLINWKDQNTWLALLLIISWVRNVGGFVNWSTPDRSLIVEHIFSVMAATLSTSAAGYVSSKAEIQSGMVCKE